MNHFTLAMKPLNSTMGKEAYALGLELKKVWKQHAFLKEQVVFSYTGCGTNVQWVFVVQADKEKGNFDSVPSNFSATLNTVNLEMIECPSWFLVQGVQGWDAPRVLLQLPRYSLWCAP